MNWESAWSTPSSDSPLHLRVMENSAPLPRPLLPRHRQGTWYDVDIPPTQRRLKYQRTAREQWWFRLGQLLRVPVILIVVVWGLFFIRNNKNISNSIRFGQEKFFSELSQFEGLTFIEADHPYIRYVGRWTEIGTRRSGSFSGAYFDFAVAGSGSIILSLNEATATALTSNASLLVRVDNDEYRIISNISSSTICSENLGLHSSHQIRVIALEGMELVGIWIQETGHLVPPNTDTSHLENRPRKMFELITDLDVFTAQKSRKKNSFGGVLGWEYLVGDMFRADHAHIGLAGMCLTQNCIGGEGTPAGIADVYFQSGPIKSTGFSLPWHFEAYVPEVLIINVGHTDWESFQTYTDAYSKTLFELSVSFEDTYVSLIQTIRALAYSPSLHIYVMRPFRGQLELATASVVNRLRAEGDMNVFWLDTSGWLNTDVDLGGRADEQDFFLDDDIPSKPWRLTERGNQRVSILLHQHLCRYLALETERCAFPSPRTVSETSSKT